MKKGCILSLVAGASEEWPIGPRRSEFFKIILVSVVLGVKKRTFVHQTTIQIEKITCESMGGAKSFAMKCFVMV